MTSKFEPPHFLQDDGTICPSTLNQAISDGSLDQWTVTSLCESQLHWQAEESKRLLESQEIFFRSPGQGPALRGLTGAPSLTSLSTAKIINLLEEPNGRLEGAITLVKYLSWKSIKDLLCDPRLSYTALRILLKVLPEHGSSEAVKSVAGLIDIDEIILATERYFRSRGPERNKDGKALLSLEHAERFLGTIKTNSNGCYMTIIRKDPPKGGLQLFDVHRQKRLRIQPNTEAFISTFNRITKHILHGLDWCNVIVAGGILVTALLHVDPDQDKSEKITDGDIDLYIYGLSAEKANDKVREIYRIWTRNLPPDNSQRLVVKNARTITFLPEYPNRRIQIILNLATCPTSILFTFDLDPCAVAYDGRSVLMLPRCARALETGYSIFTMDLICGHLPQGRGASQNPRIFKYADRGFGIRILPSYVRTLEEVRAAAPMSQEDYDYENGTYSRKPSGQEPGLKTLKRIAYLGKDMVLRYYFGATELLKRDKDFVGDDETFQRVVDHEKSVQDARRKQNRRLRAMRRSILPMMHLTDVEPSAPQNLLLRRGGVRDFEVWMRHHEVWRLNANGEARLDTPSMEEEVPGQTVYGDMPKYDWKDSFSATSYARVLEAHNNRIFAHMRNDICRLLNIPLQLNGNGWVGYLTHRIRRVICGYDIEVIFEKPITMPVLDPDELESRLESEADAALSEAGMNLHDSQEQLLKPVHKLGMENGLMPRLSDRPGGAGNLRYWVVGNELGWTGIHQKLDEVFVILGWLFDWYIGCRDGNHYSTLNANDALHVLAGRLRNRMCMISDLSSLSSNRVGISDREARLFQSWALHKPARLSQGVGAFPHPLYSERSIVYPPPDELFWQDGDEGEQQSQVA